MRSGSEKDKRKYLMNVIIKKKHKVANRWVENVSENRWFKVN